MYLTSAFLIEKVLQHTLGGQSGGVSIRILQGFQPEFRLGRHMASASISATKTFVQSEACNL